MGKTYGSHTTECVISVCLKSNLRLKSKHYMIVKPLLWVQTLPSGDDGFWITSLGLMVLSGRSDVKPDIRSTDRRG